MKKWAIAILFAILSTATAFAGDPPGLPSTGGSGDPAANNLAAIQKFASDKQDDREFATRESDKGKCRIDQDRQIVTLTFNADGKMHCTLPALAEGYRAEIMVLTMSPYDQGTHYRVVVTTGDVLDKTLVHGSADDVKALLGYLAAVHGAPPDETPKWWTSPILLGPYAFADVTFTIKLDEAGISTDNKLTIAPLYAFNLSALAIVGPGTTTYSVAGGKIASDSNRGELDYYFGVHFYPLSWVKNGTPKRYFDTNYQSAFDRFSIVAGLNLAHPTQGGYLGGALELGWGLSITGGWQPRKVDALAGGATVGTATDATDAPTYSRWDFANWGVGLSLDATVFKPIFSIFGS